MDVRFDSWESGEYLCHFRTKGSKNGVRRYQQEDGTWTPLGLERRKAREGWGDEGGNGGGGERCVLNVIGLRLQPRQKRFAVERPKRRQRPIAMQKRDLRRTIVIVSCLR